MFSKSFTITVCAAVCIVALFVFLTQRGDASTNSVVRRDYPVKSPPELLSNLLDSFRGTFLFGPSYPSYYMAAYIDEVGQLVILTVGESSAIYDELAERCQGRGFKICSADDFETQLCRISATLQGFRDSFYKRPIIKRMKYLGCQVTDGGRKICVILGDDSEPTIRKFRRLVMDSPLFVFKKSAFEIGYEK